ncbi:MAG: hypothetical protein SCARUB_00603 [Candidatus Scalindua rubra]|uniref:Cytochrome c n=1 Tax=Candidatus Scalindua rubra TaxID=1872076 RepID=A0A1E3XF57_9BACT|nr:MAG: hypothetical protein SCARUB_00603 [Candidatus Scalindua rubra]
MRKFGNSKAVVISFYLFKSVLQRCKQSFLIFNVIIITFFAFSCGKVEKPEEIVVEEEEVISEIPYESETKFKMHMKSLDDLEDALIDSVDRQNWDEIRKYAMELKNTSPVIFTGKRKEELPQDFVMIDTMFHLQALAVVEAAQSREMVRLNIEYEKLRQTCDDCHEKYKKKEL